MPGGDTSTAAFAIGHAAMEVILIVVVLGIAWGIPIVLVVHSELRNRHLHDAGLCKKCGYNLTGNVTGVCSECGTAVDRKAT
jgi:hypothetical protein